MCKTNTSESSWSTENGGSQMDGRLRKFAPVLLTGVGVGILGGMGTFLYTRRAFLPDAVDPVWALVVIGLIAVLTHRLAQTLEESITLALVGMTSGIGVHVIAWAAPLWILPYSPAARDLLLPAMVGRGFTVAVLVYPVVFLGAYLTAILLDGVFGT